MPFFAIYGRFKKWKNQMSLDSEIPIKQDIDGCIIKIGKITCLLVSEISQSNTKKNNVLVDANMKIKKIREKEINCKTE